MEVDKEKEDDDDSFEITIKVKGAENLKKVANAIITKPMGRQLGLGNIGFQEQDEHPYAMRRRGRRGEDDEGVRIESEHIHNYEYADTNPVGEEVYKCTECPSVITINGKIDTTKKEVDTEKEKNELIASLKKYYGIRKDDEKITEKMNLDWCKSHIEQNKELIGDMTPEELLKILKKGGDKSEGNTEKREEEQTEIHSGENKSPDGGRSKGDDSNTTEE